jgi:solute carrier family 25 folate transporter 32
MSQVGATASKDSRTPWHYKSTIDAFRTMYRTEGLGSFYSGLAPALLGLTHVAIQFPLYEYFKLRFTGLEMGQNDPSNQSTTHWFSILGATFLSKICATTATYPHEVLRTRLQIQLRQRKIDYKIAKSSPLGVPPDGPRYRGVVTTARTIFQEEGWRAFYYGMGTNLIRAVPAAMTTMLTFEALKRSVHRLQDEAHEQDKA